MIDWFWSTVLYGSAILAAAGALGMVWPVRWLFRKSRKRALVMLVLGVAGILTSRAVTPGMQTSAARDGIDEFVPAFQFRERHETTVNAPPDRVFVAIKSVAANEIALFKAFTWIRRSGQSGPESLLNPPDDKPILDVATSTGFLLLLDRAPHEVVLGAFLGAPPGVSRPDTLTPDHFRNITTQPGYLKVAMNFRVEPIGPGSRLITETRVVGTDPNSVRLFNPYWRMIFPGSAILRITWLRAIKARAEQGAA